MKLAFRLDLGDECVEPHQVRVGDAGGLQPRAGAAQVVRGAGGDFADGIMAYEGNWLGAETFMSFDKQAVSLLTRHGVAARLL